MDDMYTRIKEFARSPNVGDLASIVAYGPAVVIPLLKAHAEHGSGPDHREAVISVLVRIDQPIMREIVTFMTTSHSVWARTTAFEALEERAVQDLEDPASAIRFFETLRNDTSSRIRDHVQDAIDDARRVLNSPLTKCDICGKSSRYSVWSPKARKSLCGHCRYY